MIPEFEIGLFNAWILSFPLWTIGWFFLFVTKKDTAKRLVDRSWYNKNDKKTGFIFMFSYYLMVIITFVSPLENVKSIWFILGIILYLLSIIPLFTAYYIYAKSPIDKTILKGIYKYSRNPMYFFATMSFLGIVITTKSVLLLLVLIICTVSQHFLILAEERYCIKEYKEEYKKYIKKVPRYFLFF